jgi:hypothetical protein
MARSLFGVATFDAGPQRNLPLLTELFPDLVKADVAYIPAFDEIDDIL